MMQAALFDIDGTLTTDNVWKGLMTYRARRGERRLAHAAFVGLHYPLLLPRALKLLSEAAFRRRWTLDLTWYFRGDTEAAVAAMAEWVAREATAPSARADVLARLRAHQAAGHTVALVSGAPAPFVEAIARLWEVPHALGSPVEVRAGRYPGRMGAPCIDAHKAGYVRAHFAARGLAVDYAASTAYADSYSDLGLFELVGRPVAVYPDRRLRRLAEARGWEIMGTPA
jgi:HAD superfamily hydrolase (TIGR01490 family)